MNGSTSQMEHMAHRSENMLETLSQAVRGGLEEGLREEDLRRGHFAENEEGAEDGEH